mgnify:FL=1
MEVISSGRPSHGRRPSYRERRPAPPKTDDRPFSFKIHRNLHRILDRIKVPEPRPFVPDPFQVEALEAIEESDVLVTAPTGAGKTYIAVKAIEKLFARGKRCWYASPLKALSNAKYEEFSEVFGRENVGILTGDRKENPHAPIVVGTTEILRNQLYDTMHEAEDLAVDLVILDEAHYLGDKDRGVVWEEVLIYLPPRIRLLLLSATIRNAQEICDWLEWLRQAPCRWVSAFERPVPLYPLFLFPTGELSPLGTRRGLFAKIRTIDRKSFSRNEFPRIPKVMEALRLANLLPAIFFLKSRADCEKAIALCPPAPGAEGRKKREEMSERLEDLLETYPFLRHHQHLLTLRNALVGAHHGGQLPHWKLLLEKLMQEGRLDAIFSTSTVAAGVNFPARTVVIFNSDRFNGKEFVELSATDLLQMTGRAGRRGMDEIGFVLVLPGPYQDPQLVHDLLKSDPDPITSQIRVNFSMALNLLLSHNSEEIHTLFGASLATFQNLYKETEIRGQYEAARRELEKWLSRTACGSAESLGQSRPRYAAVKEKLQKARKSLRRQPTFKSFFGLLAPGRLFLSQRGTPYVVVDQPRMDHQTVEAVRLASPLRFRKGRIRTFRVGFHRIQAMGDRIDLLPPWRNRAEWDALLARVGSEPLLPAKKEPDPEVSSTIETTSRDLADLLGQKSALPCNRCELFGPCLKATSHPFGQVVQNFFLRQAEMQTIQEQFWRSFLQHFRLLAGEGYVDEDGHLTADGLWASKLRLDQPLLISEGIRKGVFPTDMPELLAALIAPFVMDRDRPGDVQLSSMIWKYPDTAKPFFKMLQSLQPLREHLQAEGFSTPPLAFWPVPTLWHWARGATWEELREISGMDEGDLAMVILRTADHLRQIQALSDTHPQLAESARLAIGMILREPVLIA